MASFALLRPPAASRRPRLPLALPLRLAAPAVALLLVAAPALAQQAGLTPVQRKQALESQVTGLVTAGAEALEDYRSAEAEFHLRRAIALTPELRDALREVYHDAGYIDNAHLSLIAALILQGRYPEADAEVRAAIQAEEDVNYRRAHYQGYMGRKDLGYGIKTCLHLLLATNLAAQGRFAEADVALEEATENQAAFYSSEFSHLFGDFYKLLPLTKASILAQQGRFDEAEQAIVEAFSRFTGSIRGQHMAREPEAGFFLAMLYAFQNRNDDAEKLFKAIAELHPRFEKAFPLRHLGHLGLGLVAIARRDYPAADKHWKDALLLTGHYEARGDTYFRGQTLGCLGALRLRQALRSDGSFDPVRLQHADVLFRQALTNILGSAGDRSTLYLAIQMERVGLLIAQDRLTEARVEIDRVLRLFDEQGLTEDHPIRAHGHLYQFTVAVLRGEEQPARNHLARFDQLFRTRFDQYNAGLPESTEFCAELLRRRAKARASRALYEYVR